MSRAEHLLAKCTICVFSGPVQKMMVSCKLVRASLDMTENPTRSAASASVPPTLLPTQAQRRNLARPSPPGCSARHARTLPLPAQGDRLAGKLPGRGRQGERDPCAALLEEVASGLPCASGRTGHIAEGCERSLAPDGDHGREYSGPQNTRCSYGRGAVRRGWSLPCANRMGERGT
jgi:hypothetical protein